MKYIDYLRSFHRWLESNTLPIHTRVLFFNLLDAFDKAGWPDYVQIDTRRLTLLADCEKDAAYRARDKLRDAGFISYEKGKKGSPTSYFLSDSIEAERESATESARESARRKTRERERKTTEITTETRETARENETRTTEKKTRTIAPINVDRSINNILSSSSPRDEELGKVITAYLDRINPTASQTSLEELAGYVRRLGAEVCLRAIDETLDAGPDKINWHYLRGILRKLSERGVCSLADWEAMEARRDQARRNWQGAPSRDAAARAALKGPAPMPCAPGEAELRARRDMDNLRVMMARMKQEEERSRARDKPQDRQGEDPGIIYLEYCQG